MSFPNIPDIKPNITICFSDAINLLLSSIAMEEMSLSRLIDAEVNKILCVVDGGKHEDCRRKNCVLPDAIAINKSVDDTIKNIIKLQMLLQFKLDNIKDILSCSSSTTTTSTSTSTTTTCTKTTTTNSTSTTTTHTTSCTTSTCSTTTKHPCECGINGDAKGCVKNCQDEFYRGMASVYVSVCSRYQTYRALRYSVKNNSGELCLQAAGSDIQLQCPDGYLGNWILLGRGYAKKQSLLHPPMAGPAHFILTICCQESDRLQFRMMIESDANPACNHDSGFVADRQGLPNIQVIEDGKF